MGYVSYIAVSPSQRSAGIGGLLLDDSLAALRAAGAAHALACVRADNAPSTRLLQSRHFARTSFGELVRSRGLARAAVIWIRMFVAPGERVYAKEI
jgi:ribosomal protein S18 acetylase RimI-like enzyme